MLGMWSSLPFGVRLLVFACVSTSCGSGGGQPRDAGGDVVDASVHDATDSMETSPETSSSCVPVADQAISDAAGMTSRPALAWTGDGYGVVWTDGRDGSPQIYFTRLDRTGAKLGADRPVTATAAYANSPAIAWSGQVFGITFVTEYSTPPMVHFAVLAPDGTPQGTAADGGEAMNRPSIVWDGQTFALAYHSARGGAMPEIFMSRFDTNAAPVGTELQLTNVGRGSFNPSIAWTGSRYGIAFQDSRPGETEVFLGLVDAAGEKIGQEVQLSTSLGANTSYIAASTAGFAVTAAVGNPPTLVRLDTAGSRIAADVPFKDAPAPIIWNGARYAFATAGTAGGDVYLQTIDEVAAAPTAPMLASRPYASARPDEIGLAWNGSGYAVVWADTMYATGSATHFSVVCP